MTDSNSSKKEWSDPAERLADARPKISQCRGVNMAIDASSEFCFDNPKTMTEVFKGELDGYFLYSRRLNPTVKNLAEQIAALEGTPAAHCTSSGMSAISSVLLQLCKDGKHIVASNRLYGGTYALLCDYLPKMCGIETTFVDVTKDEEVKEHIKQAQTKVLYFESISNPTLVVADIQKLCDIAHEKNVKVVVDNTFAPMIISPVKFGADVVIHSISKYISGAADNIAGAVCGSAELIKSMLDLHEGEFALLGPTMDPKVAFEVAQRLPHLGLRMKEHSYRALEYAKKMQELGLKVIYPGLENHSQHDLLNSMVNSGYGYGGILSVDMEEERWANLFMEKLYDPTRFGLIAVSLGYHDTLMLCPANSISSQMNDDQKERAGLSPSLVRMAVGFTGTLDQRLAQLQKAFKDFKTQKEEEEKKEKAEENGKDSGQKAEENGKDPPS